MKALVKTRKDITVKLAKAVMILAFLIYAIYSVIYAIQVRGNVRCFGVSFLYQEGFAQEQKSANMLLFVGFIIISVASYLIIAFKDTSQTKSNIKKSCIFIAIIAILSGLILPNNSSDVYYYIAAGRIDSMYGYNMYENNFDKVQASIQEDDIIKNAPGIKHKFIYGVIWAEICKAIGAIPTNLEVVLIYIFKMCNIIVHLINAYLIYKISKNKKLMYLYALNPLVLFEGIINCHNDIFLILCVLLAVYLKKKDKIGLATLCITCGTLIKYTPIIVLPYIFSDKKFKEKLKYVAEFAVVFVLANWLVTGDITKILSVMDQTGRFANSMYLQLVLLNVPWNIIDVVTLTGKVIFCIIFGYAVLSKHGKSGRTYLYLLMAFIVLAITNFRAWYILWLFGLITEIQGKDIERLVVLSIIIEFSNYVIYYFGESYVYGGFYFFSVVVYCGIYLIASEYLEQKSKRKKEITK